MTLEEVTKNLEKIEQHKDDDETAHMMEDLLFYEFVKAIKDKKYKTKKEIIEIATEVYKVRQIEFSRWYA